MKTKLEKNDGWKILRSPVRQSLLKDLSSKDATQSVLFPDFSVNLIIFLSWHRVTSKEFVRAVELAKPSLILDVRPYPRFDLDGLSRAHAFSIFQNNGSRYLDSAFAQVARRSDSDSTSEQATALLRIFNEFHGPMMVIFDYTAESNRVIDQLQAGFAVDRERKWESVMVPSFL